MSLPQTELNVENYFINQIYDLFQVGSPTADVYSDLKQRPNTSFTTPNHGVISIASVFTGKATAGFCAYGAWHGATVLTMNAIILANSRAIMWAIHSRLYDFLGQGKFRDFALSPYSTSEPSNQMRTIYSSDRNYVVANDSELYGRVMEFEVYFSRTRETI